MSKLWVPVTQGKKLTSWLVRGKKREVDHE